MPEREQPPDPDAHPGAPAPNPREDRPQPPAGDRPMSETQASYLKTLSEQAGLPFDPDMTEADATRRLDELQGRTGAP